MLKKILSDDITKDISRDIVETYLTLIIFVIYIASFILPIGLPDGIDANEILNGFSIHKVPSDDYENELGGEDGIYESGL